jgi:hypothetical protein
LHKAQEVVVVSVMADGWVQQMCLLASGGKALTEIYSPLLEVIIW